MTMRRTGIWLAAVVALTLSAAAQDKPAPKASESHEHHMAASAAQPEAWQKIKSLAGEWEGTMGGEKDKAPARIVFRSISGGTSFLQMIDPGGKYEMVTVFHVDGTELLGTHYCFGNQPRFRSVAAKDPNTIVFELKDMTGKDSPGHMNRLVLTMLDADHHLEDWTYLQDGKEVTDRFEMKRVK
jgi:hypothetical protein